MGSEQNDAGAVHELGDGSTAFLRRRRPKSVLRRRRPKSVLRRQRPKSVLHRRRPKSVAKSAVAKANVATAMAVAATRRRRILYKKQDASTLAKETCEMAKAAGEKAKKAKKGLAVKMTKMEKTLKEEADQIGKKVRLYLVNTGKKQVKGGFRSRMYAKARNMAQKAANSLASGLNIPVKGAEACYKDLAASKTKILDANDESEALEYCDGADTVIVRIANQVILDSASGLDGQAVCNLMNLSGASTSGLNKALNGIKAKMPCLNTDKVKAELKSIAKGGPVGLKERMFSGVKVMCCTSKECVTKKLCNKLKSKQCASL